MGLGVSAGTIVLNIFMGASLKLFWKMLGAVQLIVHFPLFNVGFPGNASFMFSYFIDLANLKLVPTGWLTSKMLGIKSKAT